MSSLTLKEYQCSFHARFLDNGTFKKSGYLLKLVVFWLIEAKVAASCARSNRITRKKFIVRVFFGMRHKICAEVADGKEVISSFHQLFVLLIENWQSAETEKMQRAGYSPCGTLHLGKNLQVDAICS